MVRISHLVRQLKLDDAVEVKRKDPLLKSIIRKALAIHWKVKESMSDFLAATITLVGHDGVLRGDEIFSNLKVKDGSTMDIESLFFISGGRNNWEDCSVRVRYSSGYLGLSRSLCLQIPGDLV
jgi:hypothetical protein